jgi:hypothetical protein
MNRVHRARWSGRLALLCLALFACTQSVEAPLDARGPSARSLQVGSSSAASRDATRAPHSTSAGFKSKSHLESHFEKHGAELGVASAAEYLALAKALRDAPRSSDVRETVRTDGVVTRFDRKSGAFIAFEADGTIRTFFKPNDGEAYFRRQAERDSP